MGDQEEYRFLYKVFPQLKEINRDVPRLIDQCNLVSYHYLEKHYELMDLYRKLKIALDRYKFLFDRIKGSIDQMNNIMTEIGNDGIDDTEMQQFKEKQQEVMTTYNEIIGAFTGSKDKIEQAYEIMLKESVETIKQTLTTGNSIDYTVKNVSNLENYIDTTLNNPSVTTDSRKYAGILEDSGKPVFVLIYPHEKNGKYEYTYKKYDLPNEFVNEIYKPEIENP